MRIDSRERESVSAGPPPWLWPVLALVLLLALLSGAAWWFLAGRGTLVQTAVATAPGAGAGNGALLQATGYLTARRQATVSTQITGVLAQVLI